MAAAHIVNREYAGSEWTTLTWQPYWQSAVESSSRKMLVLWHDSGFEWYLGDIPYLLAC